MTPHPHIETLRLTDFRSYDRLDAEFAPGINIFFGPNGAGKTNLLEAISLLSPGRGMRRAKVDAITRMDAGGLSPAWGVSAMLETPDGEVKLSVGQNPDNPRRRLVRIDGQSASTVQLAEYVSMLWLTPAQDRLFTGPAGDRRKFIDRLAMTHTPAHGSNTLRYEQARAERNRLLSDGYADDAWYGALEADLARYGALIAAARVTTLELLSEEIASRPEGAFPKSEVALQGEAEGFFGDGASQDDVSGHLAARLSAARNEERRAGRTLVGPHRSDLLVTHAPKGMPAESCSTGEQKALLIGLVLAHARSHPTRMPILLLDEIAAHLDVERRSSLARELSDLGGQVFLTGTDKDLFADFTGRKMEVRDGTLTQN